MWFETGEFGVIKNFYRFIVLFRGRVVMKKNLSRYLSWFLCATILASSIEISLDARGGGGGGHGGGGGRGGGGGFHGGGRGGGGRGGGGRGGSHAGNRGGRGGNRAGNRGGRGYGRGGYGRGGWGGRGWYGGWGWGFGAGLFLTAGAFALLSSANWNDPVVINNIYDGNLPQDDGTWQQDQQFKGYIDECIDGCMSENPDLTKKQCARLCVKNILDNQDNNPNGAPTAKARPQMAPAGLRPAQPAGM